MDIKKFTKGLFLLCVGLILAALLMRIYMMEDNDLLSEIYKTEAAEAAYKAGGDKIKTHKPFDDLADDGYYSANGLIFIDEDGDGKGELQLTARYNDSLFTYFDTASDTEFTWRLEDRENEVFYEGKVLDSGDKYMYNYRKLAFEDVEIKKKSELYLFLVFEDKYPVEGETGGLLIHTPNDEFKQYKLSNAEKELFE